MYQKILNFVKYNNAFTLVVMMLFLGAGVSFAANPEMREGVYSSTETVVSVDNSRIISVDLDNFNFNLRINAVTDDQDNYYATYSYDTFLVEDGVWKNKTIEKMLKVSKVDLGGKDLGLHLARELGENINAELIYLKRVKDIEIDKGTSQKIVTVEYSGLIGKLLDPKEKVIEGYDPVIPEPIEEVAIVPESNPATVILSTPYTEPAPELPTVPEPPMVSPTPEPIVEDTGSTTPSVTPLPETPLPSPEDMVDETLVQEVVEQLLQDDPVVVPEISPDPAQ